MEPWQTVIIIHGKIIIFVINLLTAMTIPLSGECCSTCSFNELYYWMFVDVAIFVLSKHKILTVEAFVLVTPLRTIFFTAM